MLQCSGNGRKFFPHKPSGTPWEVGAAGCVMWTGIPVRTLVEYLGGVEGAPGYMTGTGGETLPEGLDPKTLAVERSVPREAMQDALLAWEMNNEPLSLAHGGPLRLIVPGYTGVNNVKYIKQLAFTAEQSPAKIQQTSYRMAPMAPSLAPTILRSGAWSPSRGSHAGVGWPGRQSRTRRGARRGLWRHGRSQGGGSLHRRRQDLEAGASDRPRPGQVRLAPVRAAGRCPRVSTC